MRRVLIIAGLLMVLAASVACSGVKSVTITGPDLMSIGQSALFTATAEGGTPLYGQVMFQWVIRGKEYGEPQWATVDAFGNTRSIISWKASGTSAEIAVYARFFDPGSAMYTDAFDTRIVTVVR